MKKTENSKKKDDSDKGKSGKKAIKCETGQFKRELKGNERATKDRPKGQLGQQWAGENRPKGRQQHNDKTRRGDYWSEGGV